MITGSCISNQPNWQPVHFACAHGQKVVLHELIENYGVDPHTEDQVWVHGFGEFIRQKLVVVKTPRLIHCGDSFQKPVYSDLPNLQPGIFFFFRMEVHLCIVQ